MVFLFHFFVRNYLLHDVFFVNNFKRASIKVHFVKITKKTFFKLLDQKQKSNDELHEKVKIMRNYFKRIYF